MVARHRSHALIVALLAGLGWVGWSAHAAPVTTEDLLNAQDNAAEWLMYGRDYRNQRFSPLDQITPDNVAQLRAGLGVLDRRQARRARGDAAVPRWRALLLGRLLRGCSRSTPAPARCSGPSSPSTRRGSRPSCAAARSTAASRSRTIWSSSTRSMPGSLRSTRKDGTVAWQQTHRRLEEGGDRDRRAAGGRRQGDRRHRRRRVRRARLPPGLRRRDRRAGVDRPTPSPARASPATRPGPATPGRRGGATTWQTGAYDAETNTLLLGHRQPRPLELGSAQGRQPVELLAARARPRHRHDQVGLPVHAERRLGLRRQQRADPDRRRRSTAGRVKAAVQSNRNGFFYVLDRTSGEFIYAVPTIEGINWTTGLDPKDRPAEGQRGDARR